MQEILIILAIAAAIFFVPRLIKRKSLPEEETRRVAPPRPAPSPNRRIPKISLTGRMRLAILLTILWVAGWAAFLKPWEGDKLLFFIVTLGPVLVLWGSIWVWLGYKKYRR